MQQTEATPRPQRADRGGGSFIRRLLQTREFGVFLALVALLIVMRFLTPYFWKTDNVFNVLRGMSTIGIMAIGETMIIITGGIDLSVGSVLAASAMLTARLMYVGVVSPWVAVLIGITFGTLLGAINGLIITRVKVTPFIATLGMLSIARGLAYLLASGLQGTVASNVPMRDEAVNFLGSGYVGPVPVPVIEMIVLVIIFSLFLRSTVLGRQIYAVGSNEQGARLSGVPVNLVKLFVYTVTGALAALAGIMTAGLLETSATNAGTGSELDVIAAVVIGGASLAGGEGTIIGSIIGAAIMAVLRNAFVLLQFPIYMQTISIGVVIILAVALDQIRRRSR
jgi:ribose transport system permease protein